MSLKYRALRDWLRETLIYPVALVQVSRATDLPPFTSTSPVHPPPTSVTKDQVTDFPTQKRSNLTWSLWKDSKHRHHYVATENSFYSRSIHPTQFSSLYITYIFIFCWSLLKSRNRVSDSTYTLFFLLFSPFCYALECSKVVYVQCKVLKRIACLQCDF